MKTPFLLTLTCVSYIHAKLSPAGSIRDAHKADKPEGVPSLGVPQSIQQTWAMFSPYYPAAPYTKPPPGCTIDQVHILQRHGARYPTSGVGKHIKAAIKKLQSVGNYTDPNLAFLKDYKYDLHKNGNLVPFGAAQSFESGQEAFTRYGSLVSKNDQPFVRASSSDRVVDSATNWTAVVTITGLSSPSSFQNRARIVYRTPPNRAQANDTLDNAMCKAAGSSDAQSDQWLATFAPPLTARLNAGAPGANLTNKDTDSLLAMCALDTVAHERPSPFCTLYEELDGAGPGFAYLGDLDKYYGTGYGQPLGPVQGVGYVNELLARLTGAPVRDHTQTNATLDEDPKTFPRGRAMTWRTERMVPFSARMVTERLKCAGGKQSVRVLVNDAVMPLEFCGAAGNGVCSLDAFVESQAYARNDGEGDWEKCFE
uniref:Phytase A n=1 Tax=Ganoderma boninense TaxID=34458 RepID=A0A5K1K2Z8_9APHY|nr:N/A [Ganoderma boninense]